MMKKLVVAVAMVSIVGFAAFANGGADKSKAGKVTLKVWESEGVESEFIQWAAGEFSKANPNVEIVYEPVGTVDARAKIELDGPAGVGADVFVAPHDHIGALVAGGHVLTNPKDLKATYVDAAVTAATYQGTAYGYPLAIETYALFYNKDILKTPPKTWAEIETFAKTWNDKSKNKYAIVWETANAYFDYIFMGGFGATLFGPNGNDRTKHNINSPQAIQGLTYFQNIRKNVLDVPSADLSGDFCNSSFIEGTAPMIITGPWKVNDYKKANVNFGIAEIPVFPGQKTPPQSFSGVRLAFVSAYTDHETEARAFVDFITSKAGLEKRFEMTGQIPPRKDITVSDPYSAGILAQAKYAFPMPSIPQMGTYWSAMGAAFAAVWDGQPVTEQLNAAAAAMESAK